MQVTDSNPDRTYLGYPVFEGKNGWPELADHLAARAGRIVLLTDEKTYRYCLPPAVSKMPLLDGAPAYTVPSGERHKNIETCAGIWDWLLKEQADKNTFLINLGGGVIMDMGGFAAACFRRGIPFVNIPTSLIGQVDAAVGGKVGVNFRNIKNQLGTFRDPSAVMIDTAFLETLDPVQFLSGMGEVFKASILSGHEDWQFFRNSFGQGQRIMEEVVPRVLEYKAKVVKEDPKESGPRKVLNFGHTVGHALESFSLQNGMDLPHGIAVASGITCESYISSRLAGLDERALEEISGLETMHFPGVQLTPGDIEIVVDLMRHDKKNRDSRIMMSLIHDFGDPEVDVHCPEELIMESLEYYIDLRG